MGDEQHGRGGLIPDAQQQLLHVGARLGIQRAEGLVHQHRAGAQRKRSGDGHALLHASGKGVRVSLLEAGQPRGLDQLAHDPAPLGNGHPVDLQAIGDVVGDVEPGERRVFLEHHAAFAARTLDRLAVEQHLSAVGPVEAGDQAQDGGLAAARGAQQYAELADVAPVGRVHVFDFKVDVAQRLDLLALRADEATADLAEADLDPATLHGPPLSPARQRRPPPAARRAGPRAATGTGAVPGRSAASETGRRRRRWR